MVFGFGKNGQKPNAAGAGILGAVVDGIDGVIADLVGEGTFVEPSLVEHFAESADIPSGM